MNIAPHQSVELNRLAELGALSATIVHEVRNPLTTVLMGLNACRALDLNDLNQQRLDLALSEADRLERLLNQILQYAKPQRSHGQLIELNQFIATLIDSQQMSTATAGTTIRLIPERIPLHLTIDEDKMKQIFINLITNACEASAPGGVVTWKVLARMAMREVCIDIHNWGDPIPADILPNITQPFCTTKSTGTGLGLAIVKQIVEDHGGQLQIRSSQRQGTTVTINLPIEYYSAHLEPSHLEPA